MGASGAETGGRQAGGGGMAGAETGGTGAASGGTGGTEAGGGGTGGGPLLDRTIYLAGDSTVSTYTDTASAADQAGWGQMLPEFFSDQLTVVNRAAGGRTALWFHLEGAVARILEEIATGDYFFIQFGHNDGNRTATFTVDGVTYQRYADPDTDFKTHLKDYYLDPARAAGAIPVLVTPPPRNSAYCGTGNSLGSYAQAMRELGEAEEVAVLDLNTKTFDHLSSVCPAPSPEDFFFLKADGTVDGTHFQENGARIMAGFLAECIEEIELALEAYLLR
ncbi:MAG: rhamnogalacturonan acetylesterase [Polyangiaceae bacterium]|nr:rhamnogalacturonan acetylesterase [Polyangiaceae bacterium]